MMVEADRASLRRLLVAVGDDMALLLLQDLGEETGNRGLR